jgi:dTDP-4-amino-4,6-dideoxygalactose transaminase
MYTVLAPRRDELRDYLQSRGIGSQVIYPTIVPDQGAYASPDVPSRVVSCARARRLSSEILSLPVFPELRADEVRSVAEAVRDFYASE